MNWVDLTVEIFIDGVTVVDCVAAVDGITAMDA